MLQGRLASNLSRRLQHSGQALMQCRESQTMPPNGVHAARRAPTRLKSGAVATQPTRPHFNNKADAADSPFGELGIAEIGEGLGRVRVRQHVNPLRREFMTPTPPPDWNAIFEDASKPLVVDLGCGYGRFLLLTEHKQRDQGFNYLGVEIRKPVVERANAWAALLGCQKRVHFLSTNATVSLESLLSTYTGTLARVYIQFPDPHFKRRHKKRQIFQPQLIDAITHRLPPGGLLFLQSDVLPVSVAMRNAFERHAGQHYVPAPQHAAAPVFFEEPDPHAISNPVAAANMAARAANAAAKAASRAAKAAELASAQAGHGGGNSAAEASQQQGPEAATAQQLQGQQHQEQQQQQQAAAAAAAAAGSAADYAALSDRITAAEDSHEHQPPAATSTTAAGTTDAEHDDGGDSDGEDGEDDASEAPFDSQWAKAGWLVDNPLGVPTEREHYVLSNGGKAYRLLLLKQ